MSSISEIEIEKLKQWADETRIPELEESYFSFSEKTQAQDTYWKVFDNQFNISEYSFDTIPELVNILSQRLPESYYDSIRLPIAVAAFKQRWLQQSLHRYEESEFEIISEKNSLELPDFVYVH